jgi:hypothetical protein
MPWRNCRLDRHLYKEVEATTQPDSQGAADADVQAEKDQAKEGAWELFTG